MSATAAEDLESPRPGQTESTTHDSDIMESNHDLPARTIAEDERHEQTLTPVQKDDPATIAASEELKHTTISDNTMAIPRAGRAEQRGFIRQIDKSMANNGRASTPESNPTNDQDEDMRERISSPKKKRGRDQDDEGTKDAEDDNDEPSSSADGSVSNGGRTTRSEPEKKRPRDSSEEGLRSAEKKSTAKAQGVKTGANIILTDSEETFSKKANEKSWTISQKAPGSDLNNKPQTSASAFASSGFASLAASSTSPFGSLGASKPSIFGGGAQTSGFGALASKSTSGFGGLTSKSTGAESAFGSSPTGDKPTIGFGFGGGATSGFGGLATTSVFGSKLGNGFAGGTGPKLSTFAAPGKENLGASAKPAKAFGAPESDADEDSDDEDSEGGAATDDEENGVSVEDKKKSKATKAVHIDDGEAGEATLLSFRAKLFALESKEAGWKERGVGTLKINVPMPCASFDDNGNAIPGSFDASALEEEDAESTTPPVARLIMRQENTHRVILNTILVRAMEFRDKPSASTAQILFTAFEGGKEAKPINMLLKMSEANARLFRSEIDSIQHEL